MYQVAGNAVLVITYRVNMKYHRTKISYQSWAQNLLKADSTKSIIKQSIHQELEMKNKYARSERGNIIDLMQAQQT